MDGISMFGFSFCQKKFLMVQIVKEWLQILLVYECVSGDMFDFLLLFQCDIFEVVCCYMQIDGDVVDIKFECSDDLFSFEINIEMFLQKVLMCF